MSGDRKIHSRDSQEANEKELEIASTIFMFKVHNSWYICGVGPNSFNHINI